VGKGLSSEPYWALGGGDGLTCFVTDEAWSTLFMMLPVSGVEGRFLDVREGTGGRLSFVAMVVMTPLTVVNEMDAQTVSTRPGVVPK
jgi:hypothetical protein